MGEYFYSVTEHILIQHFLRRKNKPKKAFLAQVNTKYTCEGFVLEDAAGYN